MLIAVALIGIFTAFAVVGISKARVRVQLQNSVRLLANNIEKAE
jgi:Tfp pilus assembly protein FimT